MTEDIKVSVVIPTYNRSILLVRCIESVLKQTYKNLEILIGDNHSLDNTENICNEYVKKDDRIKYYRQEKNIGIGANAKFLFNNATGEYACIINDDDYINPTYIQECLNTIKKERVLCTLGEVILIDENNSVLKKCKPFIAKQNNIKKRFAEYFKVGIHNFIFSAFTKTDIYKKCYQDYDKNRFCEDQIGVIKFLCEGTFTTCKKAFYYKMNNGCTKDLATLKKTFNLQDLTEENFLFYLLNVHKDAILSDTYYDNDFHDRNRYVKIIDYIINKNTKNNHTVKLRHLFNKKNIYDFQKNTNTIFLKNFSVRGDYQNKVEIGNDSMLNCNLIFEGSKGYIKIGNRTFINANTSLISQEYIEIGDDVTIAWGCTIYDHNSHSLDWRERRKDLEQEINDYKNGNDFIKNKNWDVVKKRPIKICDKAWLGFNVTVLNGVTIGEGAIVGACSVVREDVEPYTVVAGNPAIKIKDLKKDGN